MRVDPASTRRGLPVGFRGHRLSWPLAALLLGVCVNHKRAEAAPSSEAPSSPPSPERRSKAQDTGADLTPRAVPASEAPKDEPEVVEILGEEPGDPNDGRFSRAPNGQLQQWSYTSAHGRSLAFRPTRRFALTAAPIYAVFRWPFIERGIVRTRGGGALVELDIQLVRWVWARFQLSHSIHPVEDIGIVEDDILIAKARAGLITGTHVGAGLAYALDLGRTLPLIDAGVGVLWIKSPEAVQAGQMGGECMDTDGVLSCEPGLRCGALELCEIAPKMLVNAGVGVDFLLAEHWSVGVAVRYFALLANAAEFPVYYTASLRLGARF